MRVCFKGEADGLPCEAFGQVFPVDEWITVDRGALKLASNPMFEVEGLSGDGDGQMEALAVIPAPRFAIPEPDPAADEDEQPDEAPSEVEPVPVPEQPQTVDELRAKLSDLGIKFHHKAGRDKLLALLNPQD